MANFFDRAKRACFRTTSNLMGYDAQWTNSDTLEAYTARVHFKFPSVREELVDIDYMPTDPVMSYLEGDFPGLKQAVDGGAVEVVSVQDQGDFYVRAVVRKYDGDTLIATLTPLA